MLKQLGFYLRQGLLSLVSMGGGLLLLVLALFILGYLSTSSYADGPDQADVVVQFDSKNAIVRTIQFTAPISGFIALQQTGLEIEYLETQFGAAVCSIEGVGCPSTDCFCSNNYWSYNYWDNQNQMWQGYPVGASASVITNGTVEGWRWGEFGSSLAPAPHLTAAADALAALHAQQTADTGGYYNSPGVSVESLLSIGANRLKANEWSQGVDSPSLGDYILANGADYIDPSGSIAAASAGKLAVGVTATDACWPGGAIKPMDFYSATLGAYDLQVGPHTWATLGTLALNQTPPAEAIQYFYDMAQPGGGWEWFEGFGTDTNTTALVIQALIAAGEPITTPEIINALNFLQSAQNSDGGFTYNPNSSFGTESDTNSTAYVIQALQALNAAPILGNGTFGTFVITNSNPISYLLGMQLPDGNFEYQSGQGNNLFATQQAIPALLGKPFPLKIAEPPLCNSQGHVVIQFDDYDVAIRPISFSQPISGLIALQQTGFDIVTLETQFGTAICSIDGVGCPVENCFCSSNYWGYNYWDAENETWQGYQVGADQAIVDTYGAVEGWQWGQFGEPFYPATPLLPVPSALNWLATQQQGDGGYGSPSASVETMLSIGANRLDGDEWYIGSMMGTNLLSYWAFDSNTADSYGNNAIQYASSSAAAAGKLAVAVAGVNQSPQNFTGLNLAISLTTYYSSTGAYGATNWDQAWAMLGWQAIYTTQNPVPITATELLASRVNADGGWGFVEGSDSDTNSTALALQALTAAGNNCKVQLLIAKGLNYLKSSQNSSGGFGYTPSDGSDTNSTAYVLQALLATGEDPWSSKWMVDGNTAFDFLSTRQLSNGSFEWLSSYGANQLATQQAIPALMGHPYGLGVSVVPCQQVYLPLVLK